MCIYVGRFREDDLKDGRDRNAVEAVMLKTGLKYTKAKLVKSCGKIIGLDIWVCDIEEVEV